MKRKRLLISLILIGSAATILFLGWLLSGTGGSDLKRITIESSVKPSLTHTWLLTDSYAGKWVSKGFPLMNSGDAPYVLAIAVEGLPEGWNATTDYAGAAIRPGETVTVTVLIHVGCHVPVGGLCVEVVFTPYLVEEMGDMQT